MNVATWPRRLLHWALLSEGSTRPAGLIRLGLAMLLWARYANEMVLYRHPERMVLAGAFFLATGVMAIGLVSRVSTAATAAVLAWMYFGIGHEQNHTDWLHHHTYLLMAATVLCALTPCGRSYSLDRWLAVRRARRRGQPPPAERGNLWGLRLMALQVSAIYFWGAYDKTFVGFLNGDRLEHYLLWYYLDSDYPKWAGFRPLMTALGSGTVVLEYVLAFGIFVPRIRPWVLWAGVALHVVFYVLLSVLTFTLTMILLYLAVVDADHVHTFIDELHGHGPQAATGERSGAG